MSRPFKPDSSKSLSNAKHEDASWALLQPGKTNWKNEKPLPAIAQRITTARQRRKSFLDPSLFAELGWEMLLALYVADASGYRMTVSNLCAASNGPESTALRWIDKLVELGLVRRRPNPLDARVLFVELETPGREAVVSYLGDFAQTFSLDE